MTGREFKPGDVADYGVGAYPGRLMRIGIGWIDTEGDYRDPEAIHLRPLVVIDPEDRKQVRDLAETLDSVRYSKPATPGNYVDHTQAALREFADPTPPRPEEPTGLGAVVEDERGDLWIRNNPYGDCKWRSSDGTWVDWSEVYAVKVLSEGVQ